MSRILITGAASGIGLACARHFDAQGADLLLVDRNGAGLIDGHRHLVGDVSDPSLWADSNLGALDGAIVNAGIGEGAKISDMDFAAWRRVIAVNLDGAFLTLQAALRAMDGGGSIVVTASATGLKPVPFTGAYGASKAAVAHLARIAAIENAERGIRVNAIAPGGVDTAIWDGPMIEEMIAKLGSREKAIEAMAATTPLRRFARADEIAEQIAFLMSDAAATITGTVLTSDGGFTL